MILGRVDEITAENAGYSHEKSPLSGPITIFSRRSHSEAASDLLLFLSV